jgi:acyl carrier protein phosphodiesterase
MNYFGHAVVARLLGSATAGRALGAMLPDFASMCGGRLELTEPSTDPEVAAGIALHHRTDAVFHHLPPVLALMRELEEKLRAAGCSRGPTRAVSHLGVELLLDGVLVDVEDDRQLYLDAIAHPGEGTRWREPEHAERFAALKARLESYGVPDDLRRASSVTERLLRVIGRRPLLAPQGRDAAIIAAEIAAYQPRVEVAAETVMRGVMAGMSSSEAARG